MVSYQRQIREHIINTNKVRGQRDKCLSYLGEPGQGSLRFPQNANTGAVLVLQRLILGLFLTQKFLRGGCVHLRPVQLQGQGLILLLFFSDGLLVAVNLSVQENQLMFSQAARGQGDGKVGV